MKFRLTPGQTHDITQAAPLLEGLEAKQVIADKGYDGDQVLQTIRDQGSGRPSRDSTQEPTSTASPHPATAIRKASAGSLAM